MFLVPSIVTDAGRCEYKYAGSNTPRRNLGLHGLRMIAARMVGNVSKLGSARWPSVFAGDSRRACGLSYACASGRNGHGRSPEAPLSRVTFGLRFPCRSRRGLSPRQPLFAGTADFYFSHIAVRLCDCVDTRFELSELQRGLVTGLESTRLAVIHPYQAQTDRVARRQFSA